MLHIYVSSITPEAAVGKLFRFILHKHPQSRKLSKNHTSYGLTKNFRDIYKSRRLTQV